MPLFATLKGLQGDTFFSRRLRGVKRGQTGRSSPAKAPEAEVATVGQAEILRAENVFVCTTTVPLRYSRKLFKT